MRSSDWSSDVCSSDLETTSVDLIEGRPDDAIARVRHSFARERASTGVFSFALSLQAHGLIADFLKAQDFDRAIEVTNLLHPSSDCAMVDDGLTGGMQWVVPRSEGRRGGKGWVSTGRIWWGPSHKKKKQ